jgi:predicted dienelactone hydrolase
MRTTTLLTLGALLACTLIACAGFTPLPATATVARNPPEAAATVKPAKEVAAGATAEGGSAFPLAEPGPYHMGTRTSEVLDASRDDRPVAFTVWYPIAPTQDSTPFVPVRDGEPDRTGAPYPFILSSTRMAQSLARYVVPQGFVWASVNGIDSYFEMDEQMVDQPRDILFLLEQVATAPPQGLEGMIDADHAGAIGYSFDGYNALVLDGARIDPAYYLAQCPDPDPTTQAILGEMSAFGCGPAEDWEAFVAHAGPAITESDDGLWQPITDPRIRAVMPMAGEGWWLFGEKGLAAVDRPTLIIAGTKDELYAENALMYEHLGTPEKSFISFVGRDHITMVSNQEMLRRMGHFAVAFFGCHLQGREDLAYFFSEEFVAGFDDLALGVVEGE